MFLCFIVFTKNSAFLYVTSNGLIFEFSLSYALRTLTELQRGFGVGVSFWGADFVGV